MKKILLLIAFCFLGFVPSAFAYTFHDLPYPLHTSPPGAIDTFTDYIQFFDWQGNEYLIYCKNNNDATTYDTNNVASGYSSPYYISFTLVGCESGQYGTYQYSQGSGWFYNMWNAGSVFLDHTTSLSNSVRSTVNLKNLSGTLTLPSDFSAYGWSGSTTISQNQILVPAGNGIAPPPQLTINISPLEGGSVTIGSHTCDSSNSPCSYPISEVGGLQPIAAANANYAFGAWMENENPRPLSLSGSSGSVIITAEFFKTFRNAAVQYRKLDGNTTGGECLNYVEDETDLPDEVCTFSAVNCLGQAATKGYATGDFPAPGAIVIYNQTATLNNGHAGIVTNPDVGDGNMTIHDSNSNHDGVVHDRTVSRNSAGIMGYIYPTPLTN